VNRTRTQEQEIGLGRVLSFCLLIFAFCLLPFLFDFSSAQVAKPPAGKYREWNIVGGGSENLHYSALKEINRRRGTRSLWRWFRESRRSELIVLFGENAAAIVGLGIALAAVVLTMMTGNPFYDALGTIAVGALLVVVAMAMSAEIKSLLIGESASPAVRRAVRAFLSARPEIQRISSLITLQHGEDLVVAIKAQMRATATPAELVEAVDRCEADLKAAFPQARWVFFEPVPGSDTARR